MFLISTSIFDIDIINWAHNRSFSTVDYACHVSIGFKLSVVDDLLSTNVDFVFSLVCLVSLNLFGLLYMTPWHVLMQTSFIQLLNSLH